MEPIIYAKILAFQSTLPIQGETNVLTGTAMPSTFQSTLPIQGETRYNLIDQPNQPISIHSPYTGRDFVCFLSFLQLLAFQSTLPIQGETAAFTAHWMNSGNFNPLSLYRERRKDVPKIHPAQNFNPLSLYRERLWNPS